MKSIVSIVAIILPIAAIGLLVAQIACANNLAQDGSTLKTLSATIETLASENEALNQKIASASSLLEVEKKAIAMGFAPGKQFLTLTQGQYLVAFNQKR